MFINMSAIFRLKNNFFICENPIIKFYSDQKSFNKKIIRFIIFKSYSLVKQQLNFKKGAVYKGE